MWMRLLRYFAVQCCNQMLHLVPKLGDRRFQLLIFLAQFRGSLTTLHRLVGMFTIVHHETERKYVRVHRQNPPEGEILAVNNTCDACATARQVAVSVAPT